MIGFLGYTSSFSIKIVHRVSPEATDQSNPLHFDRSAAGSSVLENTVAEKNTVSKTQFTASKIKITVSRFAITVSKIEITVSKFW